MAIRLPALRSAVCPGFLLPFSFDLQSRISREKLAHERIMDINSVTGQSLSLIYDNQPVRLGSGERYREPTRTVEVD